MTPAAHHGAAHHEAAHHEAAHHEAVAAAYAARFGEAAVPAVSFDGLTVDVPSDEWVAALEFARDDLGARFFDWLTAVDRLDEGFDVVAHVCAAEPTAALPRAAGFLLRTRVPRDRPEVPTASGVYAGANWHERETYEMFGVVFTGHPNLVPLLLPDGFEGTPLRKDFVLASRVAKAWPGAKEPGESDAPGGGASGGPGGGSSSGPSGGSGAHLPPSRRRMMPPGVPDGWLKPLPEAPDGPGSPEPGGDVAAGEGDAGEAPAGEAPASNAGGGAAGDVVASNGDAGDPPGGGAADDGESAGRLGGPSDADGPGASGGAARSRGDAGAPGEPGGDDRGSGS